MPISKGLFKDSERERMALLLEKISKGVTLTAEEKTEWKYYEEHSMLPKNFLEKQTKKGLDIWSKLLLISVVGAVFIYLDNIKKDRERKEVKTNE